jgi:hypothetical protein
MCQNHLDLQLSPAEPGAEKIKFPVVEEEEQYQQGYLR